MYFDRLLVGASASVLLLPAAASADTIGDLNSRLNKLEAENAELRQRIAKLESSIYSAEQKSPLPSASTPPLTPTSPNISIPVEKIATSPGQDNSWTGPYVSLSFGHSWSTAAGFFGDTPTRNELSGILGGVSVGGDIQVRRMVVGAQITGEYDNATGNQSAFGNGGAEGSCLTGPGAATFLNGVAQKKMSCRSSEGFTGEFTGRLGYTFVDNHLLAYFRGGVAMSRLSASYSYTTLPYPGWPYTEYEKAVGSRLLVGGVIGGGLEYRISKAFSVGAEYEYRNFGEKSLYNTLRFTSSPNAPYPSSTDLVGPEPHDRSDNLIRGYINFRPFE